MYKHKPRICLDCGKEYTPTSGGQKRCEECSPTLNGKNLYKYYIETGEVVSRARELLGGYVNYPDADDISWARDISIDEVLK